jgi:hypothetical protein
MVSCLEDYIIHIKNSSHDEPYLFYKQNINFNVHQKCNFSAYDQKIKLFPFYFNN